MTSRRDFLKFMGIGLASAAATSFIKSDEPVAEATQEVDDEQRVTGVILTAYYDRYQPSYFPYTYAPVDDPYQTPSEERVLKPSNWLIDV